ncbi:MAG: hypothetical protein ABIU54_14615 [Candidatus Eisenbacteria bacterium]
MNTEHGARGLTSPADWRITGLRRESSHGLGRMVADVAGAPIWYESPDAELELSPEAFASVMLLPALHQRACVELDTPLDSHWLAGTSKLPAIFANWWGYPDTYPFKHPGPSRASQDRAVGSGACFTGGLDSFHTLFINGDRFDHMMFVQGFDIPLADRIRMESFEKSFRLVAATMGKRALLLRTNLREHPLFTSVNWERTHGAALASGGMVLTPRIHSLLIPSSYRTTLLRPWGSHPATDPLWSTSRMSILHDDTANGREQKLRLIVDEPLVWKHLRVCWRNLSPTGNCSMCHKCVRAMVAIAAYGRAEDFTVFNWTASLTTRLDALSPVPESLVAPWRNLLELDVAPDVRMALQRLLARSESNKRWPLLRRMLRHARRLTGRG